MKQKKFKIGEKVHLNLGPLSPSEGVVVANNCEPHLPYQLQFAWGQIDGYYSEKCLEKLESEKMKLKDLTDEQIKLLQADNPEFLIARDVYRFLLSLDEKLDKIDSYVKIISKIKDNMKFNLSLFTEDMSDLVKLLEKKQ